MDSWSLYREMAENDFPRFVRWLNRTGRAGRNGERDAEITRMLLVDGLSASRIAKDYKLSVSRIHNIRKKMVRVCVHYLRKKGLYAGENTR